LQQSSFANEVVDFHPYLYIYFIILFLNFNLLLYIIIMSDSNSIQMPTYQSPGPNVAKLATQDQKAQIAQINAIKGQSGGEGGTVAITPVAMPYSGPAAVQGQQAYVSLNKNYMQLSQDTKFDSAAGVKGGSKRRRRWSNKYKKSINCKRPKGFSQRQHCKYGRKRTRRRQTKKRK
jgi:hypothetical protein